MASELLKLKWNGHLSSFQEIFQSLRSKSRYTDVTLACEGQLFTVHRLVLASCSQFFDHIFEQTPAENTVIILNEAKAHDIEALLDYMYCGQVDVRQSNLASFIKTAKCLQIKGLACPESSDDCDKDGKRFCTFEVDSSAKRKRNDTLPALQPTVLSPVSRSSVNRTPSESPPKTTSPSFTAAQNRWVFHRSDLPNTTWSSSHGQEENEGRENEAFRANVSYGSETYTSDDPSCNSPNINLDRKRLHSARNEYENSVGYNMSTNQYYKESRDIKEEKLEIVSELKEEESEREPEENEQYLNAEYSQNYSFNSSYERENSTECFSNSISCRRNVFESQPMINPHDLYGENNKFSVPSSLSKDIAATTSHGAVSSKLMPYAKCSNCLTNNTKLWRRSMKGEIVCNACGLYYKLHGVNRPSHLFRNAPMTRRRNPRKKKNLYEEMGELRDHSSTEERNESLYNESGFDESDTQDGLAVLNAALTLNSLFAKAKAQEAAAAAAAAAANCCSDVGASQPIVMHSNAEVDGNKVEVGIDTQSSLDSRPPPPLLKLPTARRSISPSLRLPIYSSSSGPSSTSSSYSPLSGNHQKEIMAEPVAKLERSDFTNT